MNVLANSNTRNILAALCVFGLLMLPFVASAQVIEVLNRNAQLLFWALVNTVFGFFVWMAGLMLNYTITNFVVGFGAIYIDGGLGYSVNLLWGMVRDVFNLTFIFGLVFIGFKLIFNSGDSSAKRMLGSLILAALLVNFSLFFTKIIIDFANIAAAQFATGFLNGTTYDVSGTFMSLFGLGSLWGREMSLPSLQAGQGWAYIFLSMILFIIAAFVFFAGGILLAIRFVVLNIYMILSPIMFLGWVFPGFSGTSREYWSGFLQRAFFAPAYMLMLYLANQVLVNYRTSLAPGSTLGGIYNESATVAAQNFNNTVPFFLVAAIFLIASLVVAQKMGAQGATSAIAIGKRWSGKAKQITTGGVANLTRKGMDAAASSNPANDSKYGKYLMRPLRKTARVANYLGVRDAVDGAAKPWTDMRNATKKRVNDQAARDSAARQQETITNGIHAQNDLAKHTSAGTLTPALQATLEKQIDDMAKAVTDLSTKLLEEMSNSELTAISEYLTNSQVENLMKSDKLTDAQKGLVVTARQNAITKVLTKSGTVFAEEVAKLSIEQIETMGETWIDANVQHFTKSQMDDLKKSKKFTEARRNKFADKRKSDHAATMATGRPNDIATLFETSPATATSPARRKKPVEIANLGAGVLLNRLSIGFLEPADLEAIASKETLTQPERATLRGIIDSPTYMGANKGRLQAYFASSHGSRHW